MIIIPIAIGMITQLFTRLFICQLFSWKCLTELYYRHLNEVINGTLAEQEATLSEERGEEFNVGVALAETRVQITATHNNAYIPFAPVPIGQCPSHSDGYEREGR